MTGPTRPHRGRRSRGRAAGGALALVAALALSACSGGGETPAAEDAGAAPVVAPAASEFWVDPASSAARQVTRWRDEGRGDDAAQLEKLARQPTAIWPTGQLNGVEAQVRRVTTAARDAGRTPVLVAYNVPERDCGQYSSGGADDEDDYRTWLGSFARGMGGVRSVVVLEPDALAQALTACDGEGETEGREALLAEAVRTLKAAGGEVYIDAGNPGFVTNTGQLADGLRKAGIRDAAGFALNVANFQTTDAVEQYGKRVSAAVGNKPFVVDTSRNGNGAYRGPDQPTWCNPPGRALGTPPTRDTGDRAIAAFLWVKEPGDSDGDCRGAPKAGDFWPTYALGLARATPGT